jgi:ferredoxin
MSVAEAISVPKQLVVLSGKGGTGKTSIVASLASLSRGGLLADCDVDAADLHLVMDTKEEHREVFRSGKEARIDPERCSGCGECAELCRFAAIDVAPANGRRQTFRVDPLACEGCGRHQRRRLAEAGQAEASRVFSCILSAARARYRLQRNTGVRVKVGM